jgi:hypothetical protein|tara:strand:+ start:14777 stop:18862 length:4086 start_codon:yes stop_codon:yes gene_type:complete
MATTLTSNTFTSTYKDDFKDSDSYHRILFNSGVALQARELTQIQTMLQRQITRMGDNVFKEGAVVKPGGANVNSKYEFIKLDPATDVTQNTTWIGQKFLGVDSGVMVKVLQYIAAVDVNNPGTVYVQYISTGDTGGATTTRVTPGETLNSQSPLAGQALIVQTTNTDVNPAVGSGILGTLKSGVYYARGHFVFTEDQSKVIQKYQDTLDDTLGFKVVEDIVTTSDDTGLFDNQGAVPNTSAPGADRYRITLTIALESEMTASDNFVPVAKIVDGVIYNTNNAIDAYNIPNELIAKRIAENSGDYIVKPYTANFELDSENTHLLLKVSDGVAVVDGFRAARNFPTSMRVRKPTATKKIDNDGVAIDFGNYVVVNPANDSSGNTPDISTLEKLNLRDDSTYSGANTIGTARVKAVSEDGAKYRFHLFDVRMNAGQAFRDVHSIGTSATNYFKPEREGTPAKTVLKETTKNTSIFLLPNERPSDFESISYTAQRRFQKTAVGGVVTLGSLGVGETYTNSGDWVVSSVDSDIITSGLTFNVGAGTISGLPASTGVYEVLAYVKKSQASVKTKNLSTRTITVAGNLSQIKLGKADIYDIVEHVKAADSSVSFANRYTLDNGQRDNHYDIGALNLNNGQTAPADSASIKYRYFDHSTDGDFFAATSYLSPITYKDIPSFRTSSGSIIKLFNAFDFRSVKDGTDSEFSNTSAGARVLELPQPGQQVEADITYHLAEAGKLVIDKQGIIRFVRGGAAFNPSYPAKPDETLALYDIKLNANTLNDSDVSTRKIDHRRFTMKDIGVLENRVSKLEEFASLSALEIDTKHFQVLDSAGTDRTKSGFVVDNFVDHTRSATNLVDYRAAVDPIEKVLRPAFKDQNVRLIYDSASSTNTIRKGDNVYLAHGESTYINQNLASKSISINPFSVVIYDGVITLSPASDEWREVDRVPNKVVQGGTRLANFNAFNWGNWAWNWAGVPLENLNVGSTINRFGNQVNRVVSEETVLDVIEDRVLQTALLHFCRSRKVFFKCEGLRPDTRVFTFFDGTNISNFTKTVAGTTGFEFYGSGDSDFGNSLKDITSHPDTPTTVMKTDANGTITGNFIIPNNATTKFRVGTKEFKIMDISANNEKDAACIARAPFTAKGWLDTKEATVASTRVLNVQGFTVSYDHSGGDDGGDDGPDGGNNSPPAGTNSNYANDAQATDPGPSGGNAANGGDDPTGNTDGGVGPAGDTLCLLEDMKVMLNGKISEVTNVNVGDRLTFGFKTSKVTKVMKVHPRQGYYIVNNELKITNDHPVLAKRKLHSRASWTRTEDLVIGDYINNIKVESIKFINELVNTVNIETDRDEFDVYCGKNVYTVHGHYEERLQKAS